MMDDDDLDALFATAKAQTRPPSEALMGRVMADALAAQPARQAGRAGRRARPGFWATLAAALGGAGAIAGLGTAAVAGVVIGFAEPQALSVLTGGYYAIPLDPVDLVPSLDDLLAPDAATGG